ncbi:protein FAF-like, chloroplastic [Quillaja saponaria]|uniref:Protein FAF-like, chloroplastic n=1 Tax=Quillaja saponaria TaxID=32244 RepID=A0AAD7PWW1_QUISA|nr:protein FAF-like, chloroplastic [Quillaja saponaria]
MASSQHSFSSLKDVLKKTSSLPSFSKTFISYSSSSSFDSNVVGVDSITDKFEVLSLEESSFASVTPPSSPVSDFSLIGSPNGSDDEKEIIKGYHEIKNEENDEIEKVPLQTFTGRLVPPPISSLKRVEKGKPCAYLKYDGEIDGYIVDEVNIPDGDVLLANREDGGLKMFVSN